MIDNFELIINNNTDFAIQPVSQKISNISLTLTMGNLRPFTRWDIPEKYLLLFDYKLILF